jgi:DDE superfamily endonuclease/Helix-turn-helix of DDE superfamily endonuclease
MLSYDALCKHPAAFPSLTGLTRAEFDALAGEFEAAERDHRRATATTRRDREPRRNAHGAGHPYRNGARSRLLMALVWLRTYPTYEVLGFFFGLHKRNAQLNVRAALEVLDVLSTFPFDRPGRDRKKLRSPAEVMAAFPQVRVVIDAKEQRINRPKGSEAQKPYYSGKKKAHTLKTQVVVDPRGRIETVSESAPGGANHDLTLLRASGVLERLGEGEGAMLDKGYVGVKTSHPGVPVVIPFKASRGHPLTEEQAESNRVVARYRIVVEHTMAQLNRFTVLRQVFRGRKRERHGAVVRVVAKLVNRRLEVKPLKTYAA